MSSPMFRLDGKVALVTGAATGLGAATAVALARSGADVVLADLPRVNLNDTAAKASEHGLLTSAPGWRSGGPCPGRAGHWT